MKSGARHGSALGRRGWIALARACAPRALAALLVACLAAVLGAAGCATVKPYARGHLADPIMAFDRDARKEFRNLHWIEAREGSTGGAGGAGGGCACN